ncbi:MAG: copper resistance protein CopC [Thermomicrobiales bacterium]
MPKRQSALRTSQRRLIRVAIRALPGLFLALAVTLGFSSFDGSAHAELERTIPSQDAILSAPPENLQFWFTERVSMDPTPPVITVFDEDGNKLETTSVTLDPNDPRHLTAEVSGFVSGTYTVSWTVQSADDGHTLSGTFGFRIGTGRAPGAATVSGEQPAIWAVVLRWITFLGAGAAAAGLIWIGFSARSDSDKQQARRGAVAMVAAVAALLATLLEPVLQAQFPRPVSPNQPFPKPSLGFPTRGGFVQQAWQRQSLRSVSCTSIARKTRGNRLASLAR